ncbi:diguanylate cyclase [Marinospirillum sp.]|uniref:diguanylate cyclase n=1 Tax=Marinospirillum sp. TaxID=2183934 RepID=UPI002870AA76|nr:diguanylate cyclase [Marinospirillum sp.]
MTLQLKWLHQFQFAGYYAALEQGFFADEGLQVRLLERDMSRNNVLQVLEGEAEYGVADSILLFHRDAGQGLQLVAPIFQHSPNVLMTLRSSGIQSPQDLIGRRLAFYDNNSEGINILAMLADQGVLKEGMLRQPLDERMEKLKSGEVDAIAAYSTNEPFQLREQGYPVNILDPKHYGMDFYGDILFTNAQEASENPERVEAMKRAVIRGWHYALDNKEEMVDLILERYNTQGKSRSALMNEALGLEPMIARHTIEMGHLDKGRLDYILQQLAEHKLLATDERGYQGLVFESARDSASRNFNLTKTERSFLDSLDKVRVAVDPDWAPFEYYDQQGQLQGISADYLDLLEDRLGLEIELVRNLTWPQVMEAARNREIDLLPAIAATPERRQFLGFTQPYVRSPMVLVTRQQVDYIPDIGDLQGQQLVVVEDYASDEMLSNHFPELDIKRVRSALEGLKQVASGDEEVFVGNLAAATHLIKTEGLANLKVSGQTPYSFDLGMGVRDDWPLLTQILDKLLAGVTQQEHSRIYNHWVELPQEQDFPWRSVLPGLLLLLIVLLVLGLYTLHLMNLNHRIRRVNARLYQAESELLEKNSELERVSITDKLTGCYNRHHLDRVLTEQVSLARRHARPMSIVLFDLDYFKAVNDNYGHQIGDEVLKSFARLVEQKVRTSDVFGRWGGEEFLLICPETSCNQAFQAAEKIRKALEEHECPLGIEQRISAGVMALKEGMTLDQLLSGADYQLYQAKAAGRNRVCCQEKVPSLEPEVRF